jgi:virulence-associated protein VapD
MLKNLEMKPFDYNAYTKNNPLLKETTIEELKAKSSKIKLSNGMQITYLGGKRYCIEYTTYDLEPTIAEAEAIVSNIRKQFSKIQNSVQSIGLNKQATIYIRDENIAIGISFVSTLKFDDMDDMIENGINSRD